MNESWRAAALAPPRAWGEPVATGALRVEPEDFVVEEEIGFSPSGTGPHLLLKVRKRNANTDWVARKLSVAAGCKPFDVGYAGLKDRRSVAVQWFTVPKPRHPGAPLPGLRTDEFEVLEAHTHSRKLPRGALTGNRFDIRIRDFEGDAQLVSGRIEAIVRHGVPNYFGPQRFGRDGGNLARIGTDVRLHPNDRKFALSAARSLVFNAILAERVRDASWCQLETGDLANLDGVGSIFPVEAVDEVLRERIARLDIHPTGPMWGAGDLPTRERVRVLEERIAASLPEPCAMVVAVGMKQERRSLRLAVRDLAWRREGSLLRIAFRLTKGSFATTVLRELISDEGEGEAEE
jgi:tRNA pseudouridine13 synthase